MKKIIKKSIGQKRIYNSIESTFPYRNKQLENGKVTAEWEETTEEEIREIQADELLRRYTILNVYRDRKVKEGFFVGEVIDQFPELDKDIELMRNELHKQLGVQVTK